MARMPLALTLSFLLVTSLIVTTAALATVLEPLDLLRNALMARDAELNPEDLDKSGKREKRAVGKSLRNLNRELPTLGRELKAVSKVIKAMLRVIGDADTVLRNVINSALAELRSAVGRIISDLEEDLGQLPDSKNRTRGLRGVDRARVFLGQAMAESDPIRLTKYLARAEKATKKPLKILGQSSPTPGGDDCPGRPLGGGEAATAMVMDTMITFNHVDVTVNRTGESIDSVVYTLSMCNGGRSIEGVLLNIPGEPMVQAYEIFLLQTLAGAGYRMGSGFFDLAQTGAINVTEYDAGTGSLVATFQFTTAASQTEVLNGSLRVTERLR